MKTEDRPVKLSDFDYHLPEALIALYPPEDRTSARLLHIARENGSISHYHFKEIDRFFKAGDVLVLNDTKVLPARLYGKKQTGGSVEILLVKRLENNRWEVLLRPSGRVKKDARIYFEKDGASLTAIVLDEMAKSDGKRLIVFEGEHVDEQIREMGHTPLPPYIRREDTEIDRELYQTVFAREEGAIASPTAGLHFDKMLLERLTDKGIEIVFVTLHVSYSTFRPINVEDLSRHRMFAEDFEVSERTADRINRALDEGRRVIACGTTSVRALESSVNAHQRIDARKASTALFIYPPYAFKIVSGLITNFHLPKSTLLLLVAAFMGGRERLFQAYNEAVREHYRFYSYGDAMLIL